MAGARLERVNAVVAAAGAASRFSGTSKAVLSIRGEPAVARIVRLLRASGVSRTIVVVQPGGSPLGAGVLVGDASILENPAWSLGRTGSFQMGLRGLALSDAVYLWPVDHPTIQLETLLRLRNAARSDDLALWLSPIWNGRSGHPVLAKWPAAERVLALRPDEPLRKVPQALGTQWRRVPVADPGVLENLDTPEEYNRAMSRLEEAEG